MAIDLNLEIIVDENLNLLAYRYDLPEDMMQMVINTSQWQIYDEENISSEVLAEVKTMIVGLRQEVFLN